MSGELDANSADVDNTLPAYEQDTQAGDAPPPNRPDHELSAGQVIGRYIVVSKLGAGGMGVVYAAYDPELERRVAVKVLRAGPEGSTAGSDGAARLVREAQALAKLSHPNVVAVHDVGTVDDRIWIAMEYVEGGTLTDWLAESPRTWRDVVDVLLAAGRGLAAAHDVGLLHRDFKPDNVMVGADDRVRVMDFGLARAGSESQNEVQTFEPAVTPSGSGISAQITRAGAIMGTPAYMPPEQLKGNADQRSDQFSFCVTLWEALYAERPFQGATMLEVAAAIVAGKIQPPPPGAAVPSWLRQLCERGLATDPGLRFPSMEALLQSLERGQDRARRRKGIAAAGAVVLLLAGGESYRRYDRAARIAECGSEGAQIEATWNDDARVQIRSGMLASGASYAEDSADRVTPWLDAQAAALAEARTEACLNHSVRETWDADALDRSHWCLEDRELELRSLILELGRADARVVQGAVTAAAELSPVSPCVDADTLASLPPPPPTAARADVLAIRSELAQAQTLHRTGKFEAGLEAATAVRTRAESVGWPPLTAAAYRMEGTLLRELGEYPRAEAAAQTAYSVAGKARAWNIATAAVFDLTFTVGIAQARLPEARVWARHADVITPLAADPLRLLEAQRSDLSAMLADASSDHDAAKAGHQRSLDIKAEVFGEDHPDVAKVAENLAIIHMGAGEYDQAKALFDRAIGILERVYGQDHPAVARSLMNVAGAHRVVGEFDEARAAYERSMKIWEMTLGSDHPHVATCLNSLGAVAVMTGSPEDAEDYFLRALSIYREKLGPEHPDVGHALNNLGALKTSLGQDGDAIPYFEQSLAIWEKAYGSEYKEAARSLTNLGQAYDALGDDAKAVEHFERALEIRENTLGPDHALVASTLGTLAHVYTETAPERSLPLLQRALEIFDAHEGVQTNESATRFEFARVLVATNGDPARAVQEAKRARDGYASAGRDDKTELIDAWLSAQEP